MDSAGLVKKLIYNALRYRLLKVTGRPFPLEAISLEVTHRCICRCQMCNIWQIPQTARNLSLSDWTDLLSSAGLRGLREVDITGGEPFLREDLGDLLEWICRSKAACFPELKTLAITSNAILTESVLSVVERLVGPLQQQGIDLVLACGMDAVGGLHDQIRNFKGAWKKLNATLIGLKALRQQHSNLILGIKTTIIPANVGELDRIAAFAREHGLFTIISPCIITANRFGNLSLEDDLKFSADDLQAIKRFYAGPEFAWSGHRQTMLHYLETGVTDKPCSAGFNTVFVRHTGEVFPCPLIPNSLGNITETNLSDLLAGSAAVQFRKQIKSFPECRDCTEPGLERIAWPFEGITCLRRLAQMGFGNFERLVGHMGLDKYL